jgi:hypothetical protein
MFIYEALSAPYEYKVKIDLKCELQPKSEFGMLTIFGRKKVTADRVAHIFAHNIIETVETGFADVSGFINDSPEFVQSPCIDESDYGKFLMIVLAGNYSYISQNFNNGMDKEIIESITHKLAPAFDMTPTEFSMKIKEYKEAMARANHPSKNIVYAMSKGVFLKYNLANFQEDYFKQMKTPNPIFLKNLDDLMKNFLWNWEVFNEKYKVVTAASV